MCSPFSQQIFTEYPEDWTRCGEVIRSNML